MENKISSIQEMIINETTNLNIVLEFMLKRTKKETLECSYIIQNILNNLRFLELDIIKEQPKEIVQVIVHFNMICMEFNLDYVDNKDPEFVYWQTVDGYFNPKKQD